MGRWDTISDSSNPFSKDGLSDEVEAMLDYLVDAKAVTGVDVVATSTTDHPLYSASGAVSRHRQPGTNGLGLGLDCRLRARGNNIHRPVWDLWLPVAKKCHELIYAQGVDGRGLPRNIKNEEWVARYAISSHYDHVHISVDKGVFLKYPRPPQGALMSDCVDGRICPIDGGIQRLESNGGVVNTPGCTHFFGSWFTDRPTIGLSAGVDMAKERQLHPNTRFVAILDARVPADEHYRLLTSDGRWYDF